MKTNTERVQHDIEYAKTAMYFPEVMESDDPEKMMLATHRLARAQGAMEIAATVDAITEEAAELGQDETLLQARIGHALLDILARGADDTWSGRRGDLARAKFEGACTEARKHRKFF